MTFDEKEVKNLLNEFEIPNKIYELILEGKRIGATFIEFWNVCEYERKSKRELSYFISQEVAMLAWLFPESIKVVD